MIVTAIAVVYVLGTGVTAAIVALIYLHPSGPDGHPIVNGVIWGVMWPLWWVSVVLTWVGSWLFDRFGDAWLSRRHR